MHMMLWVKAFAVSSMVLWTVGSLGAVPTAEDLRNRYEAAAKSSLFNRERWLCRAEERFTVYGRLDGITRESVIQFVLMRDHVRFDGRREVASEISHRAQTLLLDDRLLEYSFRADSPPLAIGNWVFLRRTDPWGDFGVHPWR